MTQTSFTPLVGLSLHGATLTEHDDLAPGAGTIGRPVWAPIQLLADLELRLGLPARTPPAAVRVQVFSRALADHAATTTPFYARSYAVDPIGTAAALLAWRDELVLAGWDGQVVPGGGPRLDTLCAVEAIAEPSHGIPDRVRRVEHALATSSIRPYESLDLADAVELWPGRYRRVFQRLGDLGVVVRHRMWEPVPTSGVDDLSIAQTALRSSTSAPSSVRGDGSLVRLVGETSWEVARALSAILASYAADRTVIVRGGDVRALDLALGAQGMAEQGCSDSSRWRPALQALPLALEILFAPRDPYRVLELLTLPSGPFRGRVGLALAGAIAKLPGVGGRAWVEAKKRLRADLVASKRSEEIAKGTSDAAAEAVAVAFADERLGRVATWFEGDQYDPLEGAPRAAVLETTDRVRAWLRGRLSIDKAERGHAAPTDRERVFGAALAQAEALFQALAHDPRERFDLVSVRQLLEDVSVGASVSTTPELAGRIDHVGAPGSLRTMRDTVVWWHAVSGTEWRPGVSPWRAEERAALDRAGFPLVDPGARLDAEAAAWRSAVLSARRRVVLVTPRTAFGEALEPHPIWDEIVARLGLDERAQARLTVDARDVLSGASELVRSAPSLIVELPVLPLPGARVEWTVPPRTIDLGVSHSASSLDTLVGCPLRWVLDRRAGVRVGAVASVPAGPRLFGTLSHRVIEELHLEGALSAPLRVAAAARVIFDRLVRDEAATLLRAGQAFERVHLARTVENAARKLSHVLAESRLAVTGVEEGFETAWRGGHLRGSVDVMLTSENGRVVVLDLKWGASTYRGLLESGMSIQLAVYAAAHRTGTAMPEAGYFSLSRAKLFATDPGTFRGADVVEGPTVDLTWDRLERTVDAVEIELGRGRIPVTGVSRALPLAEALGARADALLAPEKGAACGYCSHQALCGKRWEELS